MSINFNEVNEKQKISIWKELVKMSYSNEYDKIEHFKENLYYLDRRLKELNLLAPNNFETKIWNI